MGAHMRLQIVLAADRNNPHSARRRNMRKHKTTFALKRFDRLGAQWGKFRHDCIVKQTAYDEANPQCSPIPLRTASASRAPAHTN
jgi:hypothetical protein